MWLHCMQFISFLNCNLHHSWSAIFNLSRKESCLWHNILTTNMNLNLMQNDISNYTSIGHLLWIIIDKLRVMITHINASRGPIWGEIFSREFIFGCVHERMSHWAMLSLRGRCTKGREGESWPAMTLLFSSFFTSTRWTQKSWLVRIN